MPRGVINWDKINFSKESKPDKEFPITNVYIYEPILIYDKMY